MNTAKQLEVINKVLNKEEELYCENCCPIYVKDLDDYCPICGNDLNVDLDELSRDCTEVFSDDEYYEDEETMELLKEQYSKNNQIEIED